MRINVDNPILSETNTSQIIFTDKIIENNKEYENKIVVDQEVEIIYEKIQQKANKSRLMEEDDNIKEMRRGLEEYSENISAT